MFNKGKTKQSTNETQTSSGTSTVTPNTPDFIRQPWMRQAETISGLQGQQIIPGASSIQQGVFDRVQSRFDQPQVNGGPEDGYSSKSQNGFDIASMLGLQAANAPANTATATGYNPSGPAATQGYSAPSLNGPTLASNRNLADVDLSGYFDPFEGRVIDTTLARYDQNSGQQLAQQRAQQALNGGLRNSNNAIKQALLESQQGMGRAEIDANLRSQGFDRATGLAQTDLGRETANNQFNASQANGFALSRAQMEADAARFGADAANRSALDYTGRSDAASQFGAGAQNQTSMFNAGQQDQALQRALQAAGLLSGNETARGANDRADLGLLADIGAQQREIEMSQSPAAQTALINQLLQGIPLDAFVGRTENRTATGTASGTSTGTTSQRGFNLADLWAASNGGR